VSTVTDGINDIGMPYTEVTVAIDETLKGTETGTYTFRQYGLITARLKAGGTVKIPAAPEGIPVYKVEQPASINLPRSRVRCRLPRGS
jgi:hypothetical protein